MTASNRQLRDQSAFPNPHSAIARMRLLIDGYNLLHATDLFGSGELAGTLQGSREALLGFLVSKLTKRERRQATIVFDAAGAPPGLPDSYTVDELSVRYARGYADADSLLEELIENCRGPKGLTVVSSDHRVQRAARQRGASSVDSAIWHNELRRRRSSVGRSKGSPSRAGDAGDVDYWVQQFSDAQLDEQIASEAAAEAKRKAAPKQPGPAPPQAPKPDSPEKPKQEFGAGIFDPFPPGYADDLAGELDASSDEKAGGDGKPNG
ncbi:MAG: NYN domain-containing protein [Planctomycetota bacterium]